MKKIRVILSIIFILALYAGLAVPETAPLVTSAADPQLQQAQVVPQVAWAAVEPPALASVAWNRRM